MEARQESNSMQSSNKQAIDLKSLGLDIIVQSGVTGTLVFIVGFSINMVLIALWAYLHYQVFSSIQLAVVILIAVLFSLFIYISFAIRMAILTGYRILYNKVIVYWIAPFAAHLAERFWSQRERLDAKMAKAWEEESKQSDDLEDQVLSWFLAKLHKLPKLVYRVVVRLLKWTPLKYYIELFELLRGRSAATQAEYQAQLHEKIKDFFRNLVSRAMPFWIQYLPLINFGLFFLLFLL